MKPEMGIIDGIPEKNHTIFCQANSHFGRHLNDSVAVPAKNTCMYVAVDWCYIIPK